MADGVNRKHNAVSFICRLYRRICYI